MKDIELRLESPDIRPRQTIRARDQVNYPGRYDGVLISSQILDSNELLEYRSYNGKAITQNLSRLFINRNDMPQNVAEFTATIEFEPSRVHEVKFRASIIQEHKEIESDILFAKLAPP